MKEKIKSITLVLLVVCSLVQSYFLIYRLPGSNPVVKTANEYIKTENMGTELEADELLYPSQITVHLGDNRHTVFYPESTFYNLIYSRLKGRQFDGFQRYPVNNINWSEIRSEQIGLELEFGKGMPVELLQKVMQITKDPLFEGESISRLLIYSTDTEEQVRVFFFSSRGDVVYEATKADLRMQYVKQQADFGKDWISYTLEKGYYIPEQSIEMVETTLRTGLFSTEQMQSIFFDPSITRYIREKDGSEIYTDGRRSLQVRQSRNWINYTDPVAAAVTGESSPGRNALSAVDFVNQHGGWNGKYRLDQSEGPNAESQTVMFQQYYGSGQYGAFPIIDQSTFHYGVISLELRQGTITGYERSLIYSLGEKADKQVIKLAGGDELRRKIELLSHESVIKRLYPAYLPTLGENGLKLTPMWVAELQNGATRILP
ncbi:YycH family regulatory protein [Paenibacillus aceti]|uniref:YycH family regulatory protein n=1 Tax=Paenibacillus aceti TaxID=1820010 RepID=UPI000EA3672D|nr:two-component system activity regulator YycH [Paenibacillus aceti]